MKSKKFSIYKRMDLQNITNQVITIARKAGDFIKAERQKFSYSDILTKGKNDFVSYVDKGAERIIVEALREILPEAGFFAEEGTDTKRGERYNWIIDPLDGTTNFIHGLEPYAVSIALQDGNELIIGVVHEIGKQETFHAYKNGGAFVNETPIQVSDINSVANALFATGFPYYDYGKLPDFMKTLEFFMQNSHGLRRLGSAATDLVYVAAGRLEGFYEYGLHAWDIAAGALIVRESGGQVTDFYGDTNAWLESGDIVAANSELFDEFQRNIQNIMC